MQPLGILTDDSVHFPANTFPGNELVHRLPLRNLNQPEPMYRQIAQTLHAMLQRFRHVLVVFHAGVLSPLVELTQECIQHDHLSARVTLVDSGSFSLGLGLLVRHAARHALRPQESPEEIARHLRHHAQSIYTLVTVPDFEVFLRRGRLTSAQARVARILRFTPVYALERGELTLVDKIRTTRHLMHAYEEFLSEFEQISDIGFVHSGKFPANIVTPLQTMTSQMFPETRLHLCRLRPIVPAVIPAGMQGLIIVENPL